MAALTFRRSEGSLTVVTLATELVLVDCVHLHARAALLVFEDGGMAIFTLKHARMQLMAEYRRRHISRWITEILFERCHDMALCALLRREGGLSVMTLAAKIPPVELVHRDVRGTPLHREEFRVTFVAAESPRVVLMRKGDRHRSIRKCKSRQVMAVVAGVFVQRHFFVRFDGMTLIAVDSEAKMLGMREFA
jgi:hypothetical protein